jgi:hypothetical protein
MKRAGRGESWGVDSANQRCKTNITWFSPVGRASSPDHAPPSRDAVQTDPRAAAPLNDLNSPEGSRYCVISYFPRGIACTSGTMRTLESVVPLQVQVQDTQHGEMQRLLLLHRSLYALQLCVTEYGLKLHGSVLRDATSASTESIHQLASQLAAECGCR